MTQTVQLQGATVTVLEYPQIHTLHPRGPFAELEGLGLTRKLSREQRLFETGDSASALYLVLEGLLKLTRVNNFGEERLVGLAGPGDVLGLEGLSQVALHCEDASTLTQVQLRRFESAQIGELMRHHPTLTQVLLGAMATRSQDLLELLELSHASVSVKVSRALLWLAGRFGKQEVGGWYRLELGLRQEDLASLVGVQRPTLTHSLTELRGLGLLRGTRGAYWIDLKGLEGHLERLALAA